MATLEVGAGKKFTTLSSAINSSSPGDTILVSAGLYQSDYSNVRHDLTIRGVNGTPELRAVATIPNGKAILVTKCNNVTIENIKFTNSKVPDMNGAGIRHEGGILNVINSIFEKNQNGILCSSSSTIKVNIVNSKFLGNGAGDGRSHGIYINDVALLSVVGSLFLDTKVGHHIKSRARRTEVRNTVLDDGVGDSSYSIDFSNAGVGIVEGNTIIQTGKSGINKTMISYGAEGVKYPENSLLVKGNTFIDKQTSGVGVNNRTSVVVKLDGNSFQGVRTPVSGPHEYGSTPSPTPTPTPTPTPAPTPDSTTIDFGYKNIVIGGKTYKFNLKGVISS